MWYISTMEYYSAIKKKNEIMQCAARWMQLDIIILSEVRKKMGMIFQSFNLYDQRNVLRNVEFPLELLKVKKQNNFFY